MGFIGYFVKLIHIPMYVTTTILLQTTIDMGSRNNILVYVFSIKYLTVLLTVLKWRGVGGGTSIYISRCQQFMYEARINLVHFYGRYEPVLTYEDSPVKAWFSTTDIVIITF